MDESSQSSSKKPDDQLHCLAESGQAITCDEIVVEATEQESLSLERERGKRSDDALIRLTTETDNIKSSSDEITEQDHLQTLCTDMFMKISQYMNSEIDITLEDYKLLEKMNALTMEKYDDMLEMAKGTGNNLHSLNQKLSDLQPYLDMIETIERKVIALEQAAYKLDAYSKRLEERFKRIEKR